MSSWVALPGVVIVALTLREVFQDLFHPTVSGALSDYIGHSIFRLFRLRPSLLPNAGPLTLVVVILCWAALLTAGFAVIYWPSMPAGFRLDTGTSPAHESGLIPALYFSLEALTNLGLGDIVPKQFSLRFITTLEAFFGLALLTASVTWIVLLYPALGRLRALARRTFILAEAERTTGVDLVSEEAESLLGDLALDLIRARVDLVHFPIIYYFYAEDEKAALPQAIPHLVRLAEGSSRAGCPGGVRVAAAALRAALNDLAEVLARKFIDADGKDPAAVFKSYAEVHLRPEPR